LIIDTSALVGVLKGEPGADAIAETLVAEAGLIPAPVIVELERVMASVGNVPDPSVAELLALAVEAGTTVEDFTGEDAMIARDANIRHGTGNGQGGTLNMLDLMVYAVARRTGRAILCTGADFAATDAAIHPNSRVPGSPAARP
jgi:ribonuclease VapC